MGDMTGIHQERPSLDTDATLTAPISPTDWPIAAAMLQFSGVSTSGIRIDNESPEVWAAILRQIADAGYSAVEIPSAWLRLGDLTPARRSEFQSVLNAVGLNVPGISVVRESVIDPDRGKQNLEFSHRTIDAAAELGVGIVCFGLHDRLLPSQREVQWFWTVPGTPTPDDPRVRDCAIRRYRELGAHAASVGVELSLETYEEGFMSTADDAIRFLDDIGLPTVGLNPDLGNFVRQQRPIDTWEYMVSVTAPRTNYWHVKNYARLEDPVRSLVLTHPTSLELGIIDYRAALRYAIQHGFHGPLVVEHYGGDGLSVGRTNERYLRSILPARLTEDKAEKTITSEVAL